MLHLIGCRQIAWLKRQARHFALSAVISSVGFCVAHAQGLLPYPTNVPIDVTTYAYDNGRTGTNGLEATLTPSSVGPLTFGKLFTLPVDGYVYAQPLYLHKLAIPENGTHNVVYVATEHDSVYAFDADKAGSPLWHVSFIDPVNGITTVTSGDVGSGDIVPEIGITGTPVIDPASGTLYVVAKTKETVLGMTSFVQRLHALDVHTGAEKPNSPVVIQGSVPGNGDGNDGNGNVPFDPLINNQRSALLLLNGVVYIGWASHGDNGPYHGWIMGYNAATLNQVAIWNTSPNAKTDPSGYPLAAGGIWMGGSGLAADSSGSIYVATGNGTFDLNPQSQYSPAYGDAIVKLSTTSGLAVQDYFSPFNQGFLDDTDEDLGSGGVILLPDTVTFNTAKHVLIQSGKEGKLFVVDRDHMGQYDPGGNHVLQSIGNAVGGVWGKPAFYNNTVYFGGQGDVMKAFTMRAYRSSNYGTIDPNTGLPTTFDQAVPMTFNGTAKLNGSALELTDGKNGEAGSAFGTNRANVTRFQTAFIFAVSGAAPTGNGITFTIQADGQTALGQPDTGLGYAGIGSSVAIKWDQVKHNQWILKLGVQTSGTFTLSFGGQTTGPIAYNAGPGAIAGALNGLGSIGGQGGSANVTDNGDGTLTVTVSNTLPGLVVTPALTGNFAGLTTAGNASITAVNASSTQLYINGANPLTPYIDISGADIDLANDGFFEVIINYNGSVLQVITYDLTSGGESIQQYHVDIPTIIGSKLGFVGFTGSTGGLNSTQSVSNWFYYAPPLVQVLMVQSDAGSKRFGYPGPSPTISAQFFNGKLTNGIVWVIQSDQYGSGGPATLRAFNATNLSSQLYSSGSLNENPSGSAVKFTVPVVANGKVYVGSSNGLTVYGKRSPGFVN
jgi:hypothetical protein